MSPIGERLAVHRLVLAVDTQPCGGYSCAGVTIWKVDNYVPARIEKWLSECIQCVYLLVR